MLTRLKVSGFKNLVDVDIRFGPFTCIAGANGVGKSNLFDAIVFLSSLSNDTLMNAALSVRDEKTKTADVKSIFHRAANQHEEKLSFEVEMIVPSEGIDDLGQKAGASITFLRYYVELGYRMDESLPSLGSIELLSERLEHIKLGDASKKLEFPHKQNWRKSVLQGKRTTPFISTEIQNDTRLIKLSQDGSKGRPRSFLATNLPRTVLSSVNATESPTALLARRELQSWRLLQLEPSSLREPDKFTTSPGISSDGSHLPATLYNLARTYGSKNDKLTRDESMQWVFDQVANSLSNLIEDVYKINVERDEKRELLNLEVTDRNGTVHQARSLSDGTLRFLALAVLELDPKAQGLICLEEPENGIHPERIPAILSLLQNIATDVYKPIGEDNPLRQVIVNTHSPAVVNQVPDDSLLVAELKEWSVNGKHKCNVVKFSWLHGTWRSDSEPFIRPLSKGRLLAYLNPVISHKAKEEMDSIEKEFTQDHSQSRRIRRVIDRPDIQLMLPFLEIE